MRDRVGAFATDRKSKFYLVMWPEEVYIYLQTTQVNLRHHKASQTTKANKITSFIQLFITYNYEISILLCFTCALLDSILFCIRNVDRYNILPLRPIRAISNLPSNRSTELDLIYFILLARNTMYTYPCCCKNVHPNTCFINMF